MSAGRLTASYAASDDTAMVMLSLTVKTRATGFLQLTAFGIRLPTG